METEKFIHLEKTFSPKLKTNELKDLTAKDINLKSNELYNYLTLFTSNLIPIFKDEYESKWAFFYVPQDCNGKLICSQMSIFLSYRKNYHISFTGFGRMHGSGLIVSNGDEPIPQDYRIVFEEVERFMELVYEYGDEFAEKFFNYEWRTGKIKRKYIVNQKQLITKERAKKILTDYKIHCEKNLQVTEISLNDYLNTAAIGYLAAFKNELNDIKRRLKTNEITPRQLHDNWADNRHGGMLFIKDPDSKEEFMKWFSSQKWEGAHPFEIVYGDVHGVMMYPPEKVDSNFYFRVWVDDEFYRPHFLDMIEAFIAHEIPFKTFRLEEVVDYCLGESFTEVNTNSMRQSYFRYEDTEEHREKYFPYIVWDKLIIAKKVDINI